MKQFDGDGSRQRIAELVPHVRPPVEGAQLRALVDHRAHLHIEGVPGGQRQGRAHRGVIDAALADELRIAALVAHVEAQNAGRQLVAQAGMRAGRKAVDALRALRRFRGPQPAVAKFIAMLGRHAMHVQKADLLGLQIGDGGAFRQWIEVVVAQALAAAAFGTRLLQGRAWLRPAIVIRLLGASIDLGRRARHEQSLRIVVGHAAGVGQRHPSLHVDLAVVLVVQRHIVRPPAQAWSQVAQSGRPGTGMAANDGDREGRMRAQVIGHLVEDHPHRQAIVAQHLDALPDLQHHSGVGGEHLGCFPRFGAGGGIDAHDGDLVAHRLLHQLGGSQKIEIEVLLDDADVARGERSGFRTDLGRDILEFDALAAALDLDVAAVLHQRQVIRVNRDR